MVCDSRKPDDSTVYQQISSCICTCSGFIQIPQIRTDFNNNHIVDIVIYFQNYADRERGEVEHLLDEVSSSLDRIRSQVVGRIENQLDAVMSKGEGLVGRLEAELSQLMDRRATLEVQAISQDHIGFLQVRTEQIWTESQTSDLACYLDLGPPHPVLPPLSPFRVTRRPQLLWRRMSRTRWTRTRSSPSTSSWGR